ncbi:MAG: hypothetical protein JWP57_4353 [Spirosoma sp.]|nr:hypothetical protein [Spirosoma sp.]
MSQQQNNEANGAAMGLIFVGVCFFFMFALIYAVACFAAMVLTVIALCALDKPLTIYKWTTTPEEARIFLGCGLVGLAGLPVLVLFCAILFNFRINPDYWVHFFLGGYSFGALGLGGKIIEMREKEAADAQLLLPPSLPPGRSFDPSRPPQGPATPGAAEAPFHFASWEDEFGGDEAERSEASPQPQSPPKRRPVRRSGPISRSGPL